MSKGFTLIEVVVAIGVFAVLATVGSVLLFSILRGSKKAAAVAAVRTEGAQVMAALTSHLRFARQVNACTGSLITFTTVDNTSLTFSCLTTGSPPNTFLASNSARLTSEAVNLTSCAAVFSCAPAAPLTQTVNIKFSLTRSGATVAEGTASVDFQSEVGLRNR